MNQEKDIIYNILRINRNIFGNVKCIEKINIGFTNIVYSINDLYILKICNEINNETNFINEIEFYKKNQIGDFIPKLVYSSVDKKEVPYMYEITEKIHGASLYSIWHTFNEETKEEIIKKVCIFMKLLHNKKGQAYHFGEYMRENFIKSYIDIKEKNIFNNVEKEILEQAYNKFDEYLKLEDVVLVHNDLHFDNIILQGNDIKIIDFERSMYAPKDYELDIIYRMTKNPLKYASDIDATHIKAEDYKNIIKYIKKYYTELFNVRYLNKRLAIYDIVYNLKLLKRYPHVNELKNSIISRSKFIT